MIKEDETRSGKKQIKCTCQSAKSNTRRGKNEKAGVGWLERRERGAQRVGFLGRILLAGRSGPAYRKLVRAASDCEDSRVVLYAGPSVDGIGWSHRIPSDDFPADSFFPMGFRYTPRGRRQREVQGRTKSRLILLRKKDSSASEWIWGQSIGRRVRSMTTVARSEILSE